MAGVLIHSPDLEKMMSIVVIKRNMIFNHQPFIVSLLFLRHSAHFVGRCCFYLAASERDDYGDALVIFVL